MKEKLYLNLFRPLVERVGTMIAVYLVATGVDSDLVATMVNGLVAAVFVGADLVLARLNRGAGE